jgi:hypothetical protein
LSTDAPDEINRFRTVIRDKTRAVAGTFAARFRNS